jgi:hypothetical protein
LAKLDDKQAAVWANNGFFLPTNVWTQGVASTADGTSYTAGYFFGAVDFGATRLLSSDPTNIFVAKHDAKGKLLWAVQAGIGGEQVSGIAVDSDASVYVTGTFNGETQFGKTKLDTQGSTGVFLAKYDSSGGLAWAIGTSGYGFASGAGIAALSDGSVLIAGTFTYAVTLGDFTPDAKGQDDFFLAKVQSDGHVAWVTRDGGPRCTTNAVAISALADGTSYATGQFDCYETGRPTFADTTFTNSLGSFVAQYDATGHAISARELDGATFVASSVAALPDGSAAVVGKFGTGTDFGGKILNPMDSSPNDMFVARYMGDELLWVEQIHAYHEWPSAIAARSDGTFEVAGNLDDPSEASFVGDPINPGNVGDNLFVAHLDTNGKVLAVSTATGNGVTGVCTLSDGGTLVAGTFWLRAAFGATTFSNYGLSEGYLAKLAPPKP